MKDDFDNGMGMPEDELPGGSAMPDIGGVGGAEEGESDAGVAGVGAARLDGVFGFHFHAS